MLNTIGEKLNFTLIGLSLVVSLFIFKNLYLAFQVSIHSKFTFDVQVEISSFLFENYLVKPYEFFLSTNSSVLYLRPSVKDFFLKNFPEYDSLSIVEADTKSIYQTLKKLVVDEGYRNQQKMASREFAESHFDGTKNTQTLKAHLQKI